MQTYATYDNDKPGLNITGHYDDKIHLSIPIGAVAITDEQWQLSCAGRLRIENGTPVEYVRLPPPLTKADLYAAVANKRWEVETGGIAVGGLPINTERESIAKLHQAFTSLELGFFTDTPWKGGDDLWVTVTLEQITPVAKVVAAFGRACFAAEKAHQEAIEACEDLDKYDINTGWPETNY